MASTNYTVTFSTPAGDKSAILRVQIDGTAVSGALVQKNEFPISGKADNSGNITFEGKVKAALGKMDYKFEGKISADNIGGVMHTKSGDIPLFGTAA